ncbi:hypothetical protein BU26DRAFT_598451 [Trematosphaeria pertusa]|uniref:Uncharacterized protein n=1 Tax=Trematosphaeria pertusa TaxID=390896 RepID=A0A6A6IYS4_9PLEO|nr:uncharacterized protein BU26DRAFT_598451 [Trematosphaeria pertusa]KAF2255574.1 hypothetical protein BU26DRAFT_598451 [Trematosphaeria pertusa]
MHHSLHVQLRHGIDFGSIVPTPEDRIDDISDEQYGPEQRAAKRRRIETIATQYLRGRTPFILSASLRGPFNKGWKNPWAKAKQEEKKVASRKRTLADSNHNQGTNPKNVRSKNVSQKRVARTRKLSPLPSPETSRAVGDALEDVGHAVELRDQAEAPPPGLPPPQRDDSGATEFFSAEANTTTLNDTSESNLHWLRRPVLEGRVTFGRPKDNHNDPSPTRAQSGHRQLDAQGGLQLAPPKLPLSAAHSPPSRIQAQDAERGSSASASMVISSPAKPVTAMSTTRGDIPLLRRNGSSVKGTTKHTTSNDTTITAPHDPANIPNPSRTQVNSSGERINGANDASEILQYAQVDNIATEPTTHNEGLMPSDWMTNEVGSTEGRLVLQTPPIGPANPIGHIANSAVVCLNEADPTILEGLRSATKLALRAVEEARAQRRIIRRPSREDVQNSAERCLQRDLPSNATLGHSQKAICTASKEPASRKRPHHDLVASPTPASSKGFTYRKPGVPKPKGTGARKSKPRPMKFSSSPALGKDTGKTIKKVQQNLTPPDEGRTPRPDVYEVPTETTNEQERQQSFRSSRNSEYSTQAAIMLAQLEFQEGTFPSPASATPGGWQHGSNERPQQGAMELSPAITPFHAFNAELEKLHSPDSVLREPPISTQDLFTAASPFAFSTVKKKPPRVQGGSGLRFAVFPTGEQNGHVGHENGAKSPTPSAERIPLKERNSKVHFRGTASEKASQETPSTFQGPKLLRQDVEFPQQDFPTSLDGPGPNGDLDFTDQFLRNLNNDMT